MSVAREADEEVEEEKEKEEPGELSLSTHIALMQRCQPFRFLGNHTDFQGRFPHYWFVHNLFEKRNFRQGSHEHWKTWKITKKSSMHGKIMEFEKN